MSLLDRIENLEKNQELHRGLKQSTRFVFLLAVLMILAAAVVYAIGYFLPAEHNIQIKQTISVEENILRNAIWQVEDYASWQKHIERVEVLESSTDKKLYREYFSRGSLDYQIQKTDTGFIIQIIKQAGDLALNRDIKSTNQQLPFEGNWNIKFNPDSDVTVKHGSDGLVSCIVFIDSHSIFHNPIHRAISRLSGDRRAMQYLNELSAYGLKKSAPAKALESDLR